MRCEHYHEKLERLCRYSSRPPVATERLALTAAGQVRCTLKTPYREGTTPRHAAMCWARRLQRVSGIHIESGVRCGGTLGNTASIEKPEVLARSLAHLERLGLQQGQSELPQLWARARPVAGSGSTSARHAYRLGRKGV